MALDWQDIAAVAVVLCACGYLLRKFQRVWFSRRTRACGGCADCPADRAQAGQGFVPLGAIATERATER